MIRKIHMDFHTSPLSKVGEKFDGEQFAECLAKANVTDLVIPGKCIYGMCYFPSKVGAVHPKMKQENLLGEVVNACAKRNIRVQAYYTVAMDSVAAQNYPEWRQQKADGSYVNWNYIGLMCFASPYIDEIVIPQINEIIEAAPNIFGFWFDICMYDSGAYYSEYFEKRAFEEFGAYSGFEQRIKLGQILIDEMAKKLNDCVSKKIPNAINYFNSLVTPANLMSIDKQEYCEIEVPPFFHGYDYYASAVRSIRATGKKIIGLTSRFQQAWEDMGALRTHDQILFDVASFLASGAEVSIGDHLYANGAIDERVYRRIGEIYDYVKVLEPWLEGFKPMKEVAVLCNSKKPGENTLFEISELTRTAVRILAESSIQCDVVNENSDFSDYKVIIWTGENSANQKLVTKLKDYAKNGGALVVSGYGLIGLEDVFGATLKGNSQINGCYMELEESLKAEKFTQGLKTKQNNIEIKDDKVTVLANFLESEVNRGMDIYLGWMSSPSNKNAGKAIIQKGNCIYIAASLFEEYQNEGTALLREWIIACVDRVLGEREITHSGGKTVEATIHKGSDGIVLHFVQWATERWNGRQCYAAEAPLLGPIDVSLKSEKEPVKIEIVPNRTELNWTYENGRIRFTVPVMKVHCVVNITL